MQIRRLVPLLTIALAVGCATSPKADTVSAGVLPITDADRSVIRATCHRFESAFLAGEEEKLGPLYAEDAVLYSPDEPAVTGREAIVKSFGMFPPMKQASLEILEIEGYGDLAYVRGTASFTMTGPDGNDVELTGKYIEIHRRQADGSWVIARDIFNFDSPAR